MLELYVAPQLEEFQPWIRWCTSTLRFTCLSVFGCNISKQGDWEIPVADITNLKARITDAFATITEDMLKNTWRETDYRLDVLRATKGAYVEVY